MHLAEPQLLVCSQNLGLLVRKDLLQCFTDLALYPHRNVFLNEVFHHCKVVSVCFSLRLKVQDLPVAAYFLLFGSVSVLFTVLQRTDVGAVGLQPLGVIGELPSR